MKKILPIIICLLIILTSCGSQKINNEIEIEEISIKEQYLANFQPKEWEYPDTDDIEVYEQLLLAAGEHMEYALEMSCGATGLGYPEDNIVMEMAEMEYLAANDAFIFYQNKILELREAQEQKLESKRSEYPAAAYIWEFLLNNGYNERVAAGIVGNLMVEVAGNTMNIQYWLQNNNYYGMAQWSKKFYPDVVGKDLAGQCQFLLATIQSEFKTFGKLYKSGFTYQDFLNLNNEQDAALAFAKVYERCGTGSYAQRQKNATKAYQYFMGN